MNEINLLSIIGDNPQQVGEIFCSCFYPQKYSEWYELLELKIRGNSLLVVPVYTFNGRVSEILFFVLYLCLLAV